MRGAVLTFVAIPLVIIPMLVLAAVFAMGFAAALLIPRVLRRWRSEFVGWVAAVDLLAALKRRGPEESKC